MGAFEDDDEDIYSKDDMTQYDFSDLGINKHQMSSKLGICFLCLLSFVCKSRIIILII